MASIALKNVSKSFGRTEVLKSLDTVFGDGEFITLLGPSGCGKTTTLRLIAGFERPSGGEIYVNGNLVCGGDTFVPPEHRGMGMVFQSYAVWPHMNVFDNVAYPLKIKKTPGPEIKDRVEEMLEEMGLSEYEKRMPSELSGGQQQRVALGRALISEPGVLLCDEPLSNLDARLREKMRFEIKEIQEKRGITVVYVTHDLSEAVHMSDRIYVLNEGVVQQVGTPTDIYRHPANDFVKAFTGDVNFLEGVSENGKIKLDTSGSFLDYDGPLTGPVQVAIRPDADYLVF
ncbi:MAG: ABC transporter ATP-binding protein [Lachnospiraceae bacterium]|nr:ABC transporter ATP-binding protein [Lachnospiraceae bacterium]